MLYMDSGPTAHESDLARDLTATRDMTQFRRGIGIGSQVQGWPCSRADYLPHYSADCPPDYLHGNCPGNLRVNPQSSSPRGPPSSSPGSPPSSGPYSPEDCARGRPPDKGPRTSPDHTRDCLRNDARCNYPNDVGDSPGGGGGSSSASVLTSDITNR